MKRASNIPQNVEEVPTLPRNFTGIGVCLSSDEDKAEWMRTTNGTVLNDLLNEWELLPDEHDAHVLPPRLALELVLFIFATGLSFETASKCFHVCGTPIVPMTAKRTFRRTLESLMPWAERQIRLLSIDDWWNESEKIRMNENYLKYRRKLMYFVDGTVIEQLIPPSRNVIARSGIQSTEYQRLYSSSWLLLLD